LDVPITGFLAGDAVITPGIVVFGLIGKTEVVRRCTLKFTHPVDIEAITITAQHPSIKGDLAKDENVPGQFVMIARASLPEERGNRLLQGNIVGMDGDGTTVFCIPYTGVVNIMD
jgi:hypothetical protein